MLSTETIAFIYDTPPILVFNRNFKKPMPFNSFIHTSLQCSCLTDILLLFYHSSTKFTTPQIKMNAVPQCKSWSRHRFQHCISQYHRCSTLNEENDKLFYNLTSSFYCIHYSYHFIPVIEQKSRYW